MPLSKSLTQPLRKNMLYVGSGWRAYFAPFDYVTANAVPGGGSFILDLERQGPFNTAPFPQTSTYAAQLYTQAGSVVPGFVDLGWIKEFKVTNNTKVGQVRSGYHGAVRAQYRGEIGEQCEFKFNEYGRLQYKVATGCQVYNLLASSGAPSTTSPLSSPPSYTKTAMTSYNANGTSGAQLVVASAAGFSVGQYIVCDIDFPTGGQGILGENGAFAFPNAVTDVDWIRKTSDFVARIAAISGTTLVLDQPFVGGGSPIGTLATPPAASFVLPVTGWTSRNGATFIQEWSGLFVADTIDGAQMAFYYPHLSINQFRGMANWAIENIGTTDLTGMQMDVLFEALAFDDPEDGETVVSYQAFYPNARVQNTY